MNKKSSEGYLNILPSLRKINFQYLFGGCLIHYFGLFPNGLHVNEFE